jgi:Meiotically up-regulated gene 113
MSAPGEAVRVEIEDLIRQDDSLLGEIFNAQESGITDAKELVAKGFGANTGVVSNYRTVIALITSGALPASTELAKRGYRAIDRLRKNTTEISSETSAYLDKLYLALTEISRDEKIAAEETGKLIESSASLAIKAGEIKNAIYVYSFPTYLHYGVVGNEELKWVKVGSTQGAVWRRIVEQNRQTSMPEDPVLLRVYFNESIDMLAVEKRLHRSLEIQRNERSTATTTKAGKEWFATTLESLDDLADLLQLKIVKNLEF